MLVFLKNALASLRRFGFLMFFLLSGFWGSGQEFTLKGALLSDDGYRIKEAMVFINKDTLVIVDSGRFSLKCKINDTLRFTASGFFDTTIIVRDSSFLTVKLRKDIDESLCVSIVVQEDFFTGSFLTDRNKNPEFYFLLNSGFLFNRQGSFLLTNLYFGFGYLTQDNLFSFYLRYESSKYLFSRRYIGIFKPFFDFGFYAGGKKAKLRDNFGAYLVKIVPFHIKSYYLEFLVETRLQNQLTFLFGFSIRKHRVYETGYTLLLYEDNILR